MTLPRLHLNHIAERDRLIALEFGRVHDGQPPETWQSHGERFGFLRDGADGPIVGFGVDEFSSFDADQHDVPELWAAAEFEVPLLGLPRAMPLRSSSLPGRCWATTARSIASSSPPRSTPSAKIPSRRSASGFHASTRTTRWLISGWATRCTSLSATTRPTATCATTQIAPAAPWNRCWFGNAAAAIGERGEARSAYERAIELSGEEHETDARELLRQLGHYESDAPRGSAAGYFAHVAAEPRKSKAGDHRLGERFELALQFAAATHRTQVRKGSGIPYVGHLLGVCSLVIEDGGSEDEAIGALLHDAAEDQGGQAMLEEIRVRFGEQVAAIVEACSDTLVSPKPPWRTRKEAYLEHLEHQSESVLRVSLADKLFNARAILRDYLVVGDELWARFQSGRDGQLWYYRHLADRFNTLLAGRMARELSEVVDELEQAVIAR